MPNASLFTRHTAKLLLSAAPSALLLPTAALAQTVLPAGTNAGTIGSAVTQTGTGPMITGATGNTAGADTSTITMGSSRTILNWNGFNLNAGDTLNYIFAANTDIVLNRVDSASAATINGVVNGCLGACPTSGGNVWFLAPGGIAVGSTGSINAGGILLGTGSITDSDFFNDSTFNFSASTNSISVATGANLRAANGAVTLMSPLITFAGNAISSGSIALVGANSAEILFDADMDAYLGLTINQGSSQNVAVNVTQDASFNAAAPASGGRTYIIAAGDGVGLGSIVLGGISANRVEFDEGDVVIYAAGNVPSGSSKSIVSGGVVQGLGSATGSGDVSIGAINVDIGSVDVRAVDDVVVNDAVSVPLGNARFEAGDALTVNSAVSVGGDYTIRADDWFGAAVFNPTEGGDINIEDTASGLTIGNVTATDDLRISTENGDLTITGGSVTATGGSLFLTATGINAGAGQNVTLNSSVVDTGADDSVVLSATGSITQSSGTVTAGSLSASATSDIYLGLANQVGAFNSLQSSGSGYIVARSNVAGGVLVGDVDTANGYVSLAGSNGLRLVGGTTDIDALSGSLILNGAVTVDGAVSLTASGVGANTVWLLGALDGASAGSGALTVSTSGTMQVDGVVGATNALNTLSVTASAIDVGMVRTTGDISLAAATIGRGTRDLDLWAGGNLTLTGSARGLDVGLIAGGNLTTGAISARDDIAIVASGQATTGMLTSGTTVDALGPVDVAGAADWVAGGTLTGSVTGAMSEGLTIGGATANGAGSAVRLSAGGGALSSSGLVAADTVVLLGNGVGSEAARINTAAGTLSASGGSVGVYISEADAVTLNSGSAATVYDVRAGGTITVAGSISATSGDVVLAATNGGDVAIGANITSGGGGDIRVTADGALSSSGGAILSGQDIVLTADNWTGDILSNAALQETADLAITDTAGGLTAVGLSAADDLSIATTNGGSLTVQGANAGGDIALDSAGDLALTGAISAIGDTVTLNAAGNVTQATAAVITAATLTGDIGGNAALSSNNQLNNLGSFSADGGLFLVDLAGLAIGGPVEGGSGTASISTSGDLSVNGTISGASIGLAASGAGSDIAINAALNASGVSLAAGGAISQTVAGAITAGTLTGSSVGATNLGTATNNIGSLNGFAANGLTVNDAGGMNLFGLIDGGATGITLTTSGDLVSFNIHTDIVTTNGPISLNATGTGSDIDLRAGELNAGTGILTLNAGAQISESLTTLVAGTLTGSAGGVAAVSGAFGSLGAFTAQTLFVGDTDGLTITGAVNSGAGDATIRTTGGDLTIASTGGVTGANVVLSTDQDFHNNSGSDAISASTRWLVYSAAPDGNTFGGLDSGTTAIWNADYLSSFPSTISGTHYVFDYQPTLTFASLDAHKTYGTAITASPYGVTGYHAGVAGAFLGDTAATAFSGAPTMSSAGYAAGADVAGGPYGISIAAGTTTSSSGYALAFSSTGQLTVDPKAITGSVVADDKTYDGTTTATGAITLNGVLAGDEVTASALLAFADANAGSNKTINISGGSLSGTDAGNYTLSLPASVLADIFKKALTGIVVADDKTYDGTTDATGTITLDGVINGDEVTATAILVFANANAGSNKTVTISGGALAGTDAANYTLSLPASVLADIFQKAISGSVVADDKTYDGTTTATGTITLDGVIAGDEVTASAILAFANANAGSNKTVNISGGSLSGADAGNYALSLPASVLADIFQKALTGTVVVDDKTYDGTTDATGTITLDGVIAGDEVTASALLAFADANAGSNKTVTISGGSLSGADSANYSLNLPASVLADIFKKVLTGTVVADDKTYDGTTNATGTITLDGVIAGDDISASALLAFADKNAGSNKTVLISGGSLSGADAGNYTLSLPASVLADIFKLAISGTVVADDKVYDGTTSATGAVTLSGVLAGDAVAASAILAFADANAGSGKTVTISGVSVSGADGANYTLTLPATTLADIFRAAITVTANSLGKDQGTADPALTYAVTSGQLFGSDTLSGALLRAPGELPGDYAILQGTLAASANYELTFIPGVLTVEPRIIFNDALRSLLGWEDSLRIDDGQLLIIDERDCDAQSEQGGQCASNAGPVTTSATGRR